MSFLTPLYLAGALTIALPILFHLIRRTPKGQQQFSSLLFLSPTPPRITRRSRLEHWLLLLLRAAALLLLAFAFTRPFFREFALLDFRGPQGRQIVILLDTSASMRQAGVWRAAQAQVRQALASVEDADQLALFTFNSATELTLDFNDLEKVTGSQQSRNIQQEVNRLEPTWAISNLGDALISAAEVLDARSQEQEAGAARQIFLITDMQRGASIDALQNVEWPESVRVEVFPASHNAPTNASLSWLGLEIQEGQPVARVRISNQADSLRDDLRLQWFNGQDEPHVEPAISMQVPPGQTRIANLPFPPPEFGATQLRLFGDDHDFDNTLHLTPLRKQNTQVLYVGQDEADDPEGLLFYLERALIGNEFREIKVASLQPAAWDAPSLQGVQLVVLSSPLDPAAIAPLREYLERGGRVVCVFGDPSILDTARQLGQWRDAACENQTAEDYAMLADIDFTSPMFAPFATPRYNDFTKVRIWNFRRLRMRMEEEMSVLARLDTGDTAIVLQRIGRGSLFCFTFGWQPHDSQLARSSKFVPIMMSLLTDTNARTTNQFLVQQAVPLGDSFAGQARVQTPEGAFVDLEGGMFREAEQPGIYRAFPADGFGSEGLPFAVNLAPQESVTERRDVTELEKFGMRLGLQNSRTQEMELQRQLRDQELEGKQRLWQWLAATCVVLLVAETLIAARTTQKHLTGSPS